MNYVLSNGEQTHAEHPDTFDIPAEIERKNLLPGMFAKLVFLTEDCGGERMWVKVISNTPEGYVGSLANQPFSIEDLDHGDLVTFKPEHVIDIHIED